uniref:Uncharacterized protein n=1 Tax=Parascaris equorum TaxID=6256 RepID=A0A914S326_PAREQ
MNSTLFQNTLLAILVGSFMLFIICVLCTGALSDRGLCCRDYANPSFRPRKNSKAAEAEKQHIDAKSPPEPPPDSPLLQTETSVETEPNEIGERSVVEKLLITETGDCCVRKIVSFHLRHCILISTSEGTALHAFLFPMTLRASLGGMPKKRT